MIENRRILIVDDQRDLRDELARLLRRSTQSEASSLIQQIRDRIGKNSEPRASASAGVIYDVTTVGQGKDAFEMVKRAFTEAKPYAVVFLDMRMPPGWDGLETAQRIRGIDKEIQIVIMTAYSDYEQQEIAERVSEPGKLLYLKKPFHPEEIRQVALAMSENWNISRREKERQILTNRLMRENSSLTRRGERNLNETYRAVLDAFVSFLDASAGIIARRSNGDLTVCAATSPEDERTLLGELTQTLRSATRITTDEKRGSALLPISQREFDGFIYVPGKTIVFSYDELSPFLEILLETADEVLRNAFLAQQRDERRMLAAVRVAMDRINVDVRLAQERIHEQTARLRDLSRAGPIQDSCRRIESQIDDVRALAGDILEFCSGHQQELLKTRTSLSEIVTRAVDGLAPEAEAARVKINATVAPNVVLSCDADALSRCLGNLIKNAIAALLKKPGNVFREVKVSGSYRDPNRKLIELKVVDNGSGIEQAMIDRVFDPFVSYSQEGRTGLGTTIARQIVENHGGQIEFETKLNEGTTFTIRLPSGL